MVANQQTTGYDERYKFTGKERDAETGYDYFGARYYLPDYSIFSTVDPLTDKNIELTSYMYCDGNPIKFVDKDGLDITLAGANNSSVTVRTDLIDVSVNVSKLNIDFGGTYDFQGDEILSAALDIVGIFDPSGIADGINVALQLKNGDKSGAFISTIALVPYVGDCAKIGKIKNGVKVITNALEEVNKGKRLTTTIYRNGQKIDIPIPDGYRKIKQKSHGQPIYTNGKKYISPDADGHNVGVWKMADSPKELNRRATRNGTYDENLQNRIGD